MKKNKTENIIIIGGGPAGLAAAIYAARAGLSPLVFAGSPPGGQLMLTSEVENYPGVESILGSALIEKMRKQAQKFGARIVDENITTVDFAKRPFRVYISTDSQENFISTYCNCVIIATGGKALWLGLESERRLRGKGVSVCATCDGFFFRDKIVAVVGGGDAAMEEALTLTRFAKKVYLIHRRSTFKACKLMQERVFENHKIEVIWNSQVEEVLGKERVEGIKIKSHQVKLGQVVDPNPVRLGQILKVDGLFVAIGHRPDTEIFKGQIDLDENGYVITTDRIARENLSLKLNELKIPKFDYQYSSQTSVKGVFAAGDCVDFIYRQVATAVGMGAAAALEAGKFLELNY